MSEYSNTSQHDEPKSGAVATALALLGIGVNVQPPHVMHPGEAESKLLRHQVEDLYGHAAADRISVLLDRYVVVHAENEGTTPVLESELQNAIAIGQNGEAYAFLVRCYGFRTFSILGIDGSPCVTVQASDVVQLPASVMSDTGPTFLTPIVDARASRTQLLRACCKAVLVVSLAMILRTVEGQEAKARQLKASLVLGLLESFGDSLRREAERAFNTALALLGEEHLQGSFSDYLDPEAIPQWSSAIDLLGLRVVEHLVYLIEGCKSGMAPDTIVDEH